MRTVIQTAIDNLDDVAKELDIDLRSEIKILDKKDEVDVNRGIGLSFISAEQIEQLKQGKVIFFDDGEYTHIICLKEVEDEDIN